MLQLCTVEFELEDKDKIGALPSQQIAPFRLFKKIIIIIFLMCLLRTVFWLVSSCSFPPSYLFTEPPI